MKKETKKTRKTKERKKSIWLRRLTKVNIYLILCVFLFYLAAGIFFDSKFFQRDLSEKYGIVAGSTNIILSVRFVGPPEKPVVTATPLCNGSSPYIKLTWDTTSDTDSYDIDRDGNPLVVGLIGTSYDDYAVTYPTSYSYAVTALGPLGNTASDPVSATVSNACHALPSPTCVITKFDKINLAGFTGTPKTENRKPKIYGTTNMPIAIIDIKITGKSKISATTYANSNGYWDWKPYHELDFGSYAITVTAIDPGNLARTATDSLSFKIIQKKEKEEISVPQKPEEITPPKPSPPEEITEPFKLYVTVENPDKIVYAGKNLDIKVDIKNTEKFPPQEKELRYEVMDKNDTVVYETRDFVSISGDQSFQKLIALPRLLKPGQYKIVVESDYKDALISSEDLFWIKEMPIVNLGGGVTFTLTQLLSQLSWLIIGLLLLLIIFILLLLAEHWIYEKSLIHITEQMLRDRGFIRKRKGVSR